MLSQFMKHNTLCNKYFVINCNGIQKFHTMSSFVYCSMSAVPFEPKLTSLNETLKET